MLQLDCTCFCRTNKNHSYSDGKFQRKIKLESNLEKDDISRLERERESPMGRAFAWLAAGLGSVPASLMFPQSPPRVIPEHS